MRKIVSDSEDIPFHTFLHPILPKKSTYSGLRKLFSLFLNFIEANKNTHSDTSELILFFKGYLRYKTTLCHKVALDVQLMNFFI